VSDFTSDLFAPGIADVGRAVDEPERGADEVGRDDALADDTGRDDSAVDGLKTNKLYLSYFHIFYNDITVCLYEYLTPSEYHSSYVHDNKQLISIKVKS
jgi:hypothetical protein